jgi:hypothetical protein
MNTPVSDKSVCIVGHGPSLKGAGLGSRIDSFDCVVRLKNCYMLLAEYGDYGRKTDVMCSSTEVLPTLPKVKAKEYWGYPKKGQYNKASVQWLQRQVAGRVRVPLEACEKWNQFFRDMGAKHPNVSTGMGALIIALDLRRPKSVTLAGFDKVFDPSIDGYQSTVPTPWNDGGNKDTGHDWEAERVLLDVLATFYKVEITNLASGHKLSPGGLELCSELPEGVS